MSGPELSVVIPTHNPHLGRLRETLAGLCGQTLPAGRWEAILVDNASTAFPAPTAYADVAPPGLTIVREPRLGLTAARVAGIRQAQGGLVVFVDDDNVLDPSYLECTVAIFGVQPRLGAAGGKSAPRFEARPAPWHAEFFPLLALRDLGETALVAPPFGAAGADRRYPDFAPIGAGLALRAAAARQWADATKHDARRLALDRKGHALVSGGDNDLVLTVLEQGWEAGYFPSLRLQHLIPRERMEPAYLGRLNRAVQRSWVQVLDFHGIRPWAPVPRWTVPLRQAKAYLTSRAWTSPAAQVRWQGIRGKFEGLGAL
jgi:hypothetical protein